MELKNITRVAEDHSSRGWVPFCDHSKGREKHCLRMVWWIYPRAYTTDWQVDVVASSSTRGRCHCRRHGTIMRETPHWICWWNGEIVENWKGIKGTNFYNERTQKFEWFHVFFTIFFFAQRLFAVFSSQQTKMKAWVLLEMDLALYFFIALLLLWDRIAFYLIRFGTFPLHQGKESSSPKLLLLLQNTILMKAKLLLLELIKRFDSFFDSTFVF